MTHPAETRHWAITEEWLRLLLDSDPKASFDLSDEREPSGMRVENGVAIIPICGPLTRREDFFAWLFGDATYEGIAAAFSKAMADGGVRSIVLDIDSPGGEVSGCSELADLIYSARGTKPIASYISGYCASAAYWIASAADRIVCSPTSMLGSIGVRTALVDRSKQDAAAGVKRIDIVSSQSPYKVTDPTKDEDLARVQKQIDDLGAVFVSSVARNRGVSDQVVTTRYGKGDCIVGAGAVAAGLADAVGTIGDAIQGATARRPQPTSAVAAAPTAKENDMLTCAKCEKEFEGKSYCEGCYSEASKAAAPLPEEEDGEDEGEESKALVAQLGQLTGKTDHSEIVGVVSAWRDAHAQVAALSAELAALKSTQVLGEFDRLVEAGRKAGKLSPAQAKGEFVASLRRSPEGLATIKAYLETAPQLVQTEESKEPKVEGTATTPATGEVELSEEQKKICSMFAQDPKTIAAVASARR